MLRKAILISAVCATLGLGLGGCGNASTNSDSSPKATVPKASSDNPATGGDRTKPKIVTPKGPAPEKLVKEELIQGTGTEAREGDEVTIHYVGAGYKSGTEFESSWKEKKPFSFTLGAGEVIRGWDEGITGMQVGGRRELITPPSRAYGSRGTKVIAPGATLVFVIDLLAVRHAARE